MNRPWMPLYVADYLADTAHLNTAEHGAYLLLIMHYWTKGGLPEGEEAIRRITRMTSRQWSQSRDLLRSLFGDHWRHKRIDMELSKAIEKSHVNSANAKRSHSDRRADAQRTHTHSLSQSESEREEDRSLRSRARASRLASDWKPDEGLREYARLQGLTERETEATSENFRDYWIAKSGQGAVKVDWPATWRKWVRTEIERRVSRSSPRATTPRPGSREDRQEKTQDAIQQLSEFIEARADERRTGGAAGEAPTGIVPFAKPA